MSLHLQEEEHPLQLPPPRLLEQRPLQRPPRLIVQEPR
jgi:hypothetical protein